jgi:rSAM/selenodomain-associated transferase 2
VSSNPTSFHPRVSVIIPTLDEERSIESSLASARGAFERIVVDGGSVDGTVAIATAAGARVLKSARGRGRQLTAGAEAATGDVLLFLHADSRLPPGFAASVGVIVARCGCTWGRFDVRFDDSRLVFALLARMISWRSRWTRGATGDQAIFVLRSAFKRVGGFRETGLFEDVSLCRRLKRDGRMGVPDGYVVTSARRWRAGGTVRTTVRIWCLKTLYLLGVPTRALERFYADVR